MKKLNKITKVNYINGAIQGNFEISIEFDDFSEDTINKTYQQIRDLYKTLILKCPGCLIPKIESKSLLMKINISTIKKFLECFIGHPVLSQNSSVIEFFSKEKINSTSNKSLNIQKMRTMIENDDNDFDFDKDLSNIEENDKFNKSDNLNENKSNSENLFDGFEIIEKDDYKEFIDKDEETELLNLYIEENNKNGYFQKAKSFATSMVNYIKSYSNSNDNYENNYSNTLSNTIQEKDFEFIKSNYSELGENIEINNYKLDISRIKEGLQNLINNFKKEDAKDEGIINISEKKMKSLDEIIKIFKEVQTIENNNINKDENINENKEEDNEERKDIDKNQKEKLNIKCLNEDINKLEEYSSINKKFIKEKLLPVIEELIDLKEILEALEDIFSRKDNHIIFLVKLHGKLNEKIKESESMEDHDKNKKKINNEVNSFRKKVEREKSFINKINKDLKYEIEQFRETKENKIYELINNLYKNNYLKECEIIEIFNKEYSYSDSENSSKIKINSDNNEDKNEIKNDNDNSWEEVSK